jgi:hypothetical protein
MTDKASPTGWVVQVIIPAPITQVGAQATALSAPSFRYFNVAIADPRMAIEATSKHLPDADADDLRIGVVRGLSSKEIDALSLLAGEVKPA